MPRRVALLAGCGQRFAAVSFLFFAAAFFLGIFAPACRASLSAMATACLRLRTLAPDEDLSVPVLNSRMTFRTFLMPPRRRRATWLSFHDRIRQDRCEDRANGCRPNYCRGQ